MVGFGNFETRERKSERGKNPRKPEEVIQIPASKALSQSRKIFRKQHRRHPNQVERPIFLMRIDKFLKQQADKVAVAKEACEGGRSLTESRKLATKSDAATITVRF